jgi:POT family proton-dependent oligopeptide transporter
MWQRQFHPQGLSTLFFTEMWERFSYYGMRALLVLYLVNSLEYSREQALQVYATYTGLVYLAPIVGGYLADKWLGKRRAVFIGAFVMAMGHFAMAVPALLYQALGLLVVGNGFFKPNISTMVGSLYAQNDERRDAGFTIFYMGINLGAFLAPLVCGTLGEKWGWHYGFAAAGVGMLLGLWIFYLGQSRLGQAGINSSRYIVQPNVFPRPQDWRLMATVCGSAVALVLLVVWLWPYTQQLFVGIPDIVVALSGILLLVIAIAGSARGARYSKVFSSDSSAEPETDHRLTRQDIQRMIALLIIGAFVVFFWMGFEQAGGTMNLFALQQTDRNLWGWDVPASFFQALNPLFILLLAPLFSLLWVRLDRSRYALSAVTKQGVGMIILGCGFVVLAFAQQQTQISGVVSPLWLVAVYFLHTCGEICLSPIGLSMVTKLSPAHLVSLMMGLWMTVFAIATYLAGTLEAMLQGSGIPLYWFLTATSIGAGSLLLTLNPVLKKLMHGVR